MQRLKFYQDILKISSSFSNKSFQGKDDKGDYILINNTDSSKYMKKLYVKSIDKLKERIDSLLNIFLHLKKSLTTEMSYLRKQSIPVMKYQVYTVEKTMDKFFTTRWDEDEEDDEEEEEYNGFMDTNFYCKGLFYKELYYSYEEIGSKRTNKDKELERMYGKRFEFSDKELSDAIKENNRKNVYDYDSDDDDYIGEDSSIKFNTNLETLKYLKDRYRDLLKLKRSYALYDDNDHDNSKLYEDRIVNSIYRSQRHIICKNRFKYNNVKYKSNENMERAFEPFEKTVDRLTYLFGKNELNDFINLLDQEFLRISTYCNLCIRLTVRSRPVLMSMYLRWKNSRKHRLLNQTYPKGVDRVKSEFKIEHDYLIPILDEFAHRAEGQRPKLYEIYKLSADMDERELKSYPPDLCMMIKMVRIFIKKTNFRITGQYDSLSANLSHIVNFLDKFSRASDNQFIIEIAKDISDCLSTEEEMKEVPVSVLHTHVSYENCKNIEIMDEDMYLGTKTTLWEYYKDLLYSIKKTVTHTIPTNYVRVFLPDEEHVGIEKKPFKEVKQTLKNFSSKAKNENLHKIYEIENNCVIFNNKTEIYIKPDPIQEVSKYEEERIIPHKVMKTKEIIKKVEGEFVVTGKKLVANYKNFKKEFDDIDHIMIYFKSHYEDMDPPARRALFSAMKVYEYEREEPSFRLDEEHIYEGTNGRDLEGQLKIVPIGYRKPDKHIKSYEQVETTEYRKETSTKTKTTTVGQIHQMMRKDGIIKSIYPEDLPITEIETILVKDLDSKNSTFTELDTDGEFKTIKMIQRNPGVTIDYKFLEEVRKEKNKEKSKKQISLIEKSNIEVKTINQETIQIMNSIPVLLAENRLYSGVQLKPTLDRSKIPSSMQVDESKHRIVKNFEGYNSEAKSRIIESAKKTLKNIDKENSKEPSKKNVNLCKRPNEEELFLHKNNPASSWHNEYKQIRRSGLSKTLIASLIANQPEILNIKLRNLTLKTAPMEMSKGRKKMLFDNG
jgi:hypothetical protein